MADENQQPQQPHKPNDWTRDKDARDQRKLILQEWAHSVQLERDRAHLMLEHSVTYGSTAIQAAYILNGGALAALPPLMQGISVAARAGVPSASIAFVCGIAFAAVASLSAYLNYQWLAQSALVDENNSAQHIGRLYGGLEEEPKSKSWYDRGVRVTYVLALVFAMASFVAFVWGALSFIRLAA